MQDDKNERSEVLSSNPKQQNILSYDISFWGVEDMTAISVICFWFGSYADDGWINEPICAYAGDARVATN